MARTRRRGFTLVELLVVITIIGMLVALLLPAVQQAREAARNISCKNNVRQLVVAAQNFESQRKRFPGYANPLPVGTNFRKVGWVTEMLVEIEQAALYEEWKDPLVNTPEAPFIALLHCPSQGSPDRSSPLCSFVYNTGIIPGDFTSNYGDFENPTPLDDIDFSDAVSRAMWIQTQDAKNTIGTDRWMAKYAPLYGVANRSLDWDVNMNDMYDGATNTLIFSESLQAHDWNAVTSRTIDQWYETRFINGFCWLYTTPHSGFQIKGLPDGTRRALPITHVEDMPEIKINGVIDIFLAPTPADARPTAYHPGGVNGGFAGGQVVFISEQTDYHVYQSLMTPNNRRSMQPTPTYNLKPKDFEP